MNKRGLELTINFVVMLILGLAMLGGALTLTSKLFSSATKHQETVDQNTQNEIRRLITDTDSLVVIYPSRKTIARKDSGIFGVGVQNTLTTSGVDDDFSIFVEFSKSYNEDNEVICERTSSGIGAGTSYSASKYQNICRDVEDWLNYGRPTKTIRKNEVYSFNTLVSVPKSVPHGVYIFDVKTCIGSVCDSNAAVDTLYGGVKKIYVKVE